MHLAIFLFLLSIDDTPASPDNDTPASPEGDKNKSKLFEAKKNTSETSDKPDPKVIPLERQFLRKTAEFDIRSPKDWHRGLRATSATSSASPSSECSDDSDKGQKRLQVRYFQMQHF